MAIKAKGRPSENHRHGSKWKPRFQRAIEAVETLSLGQRESLVELLKKRNSEARRKEIEVEIEESLKEHELGRSKIGTLDDLMKDLER